MPEYQGFCGASEQQRSPLADSEQSINWYPVRVQPRSAPARTVLYPTPGQRPWIQTTDVGTRAITNEIEGRVFAVVGGSFFELFRTGTATLRGVVAQDNNPATISYSGYHAQVGSISRLFITSGTNGYIYDLATNVLTLVLSGVATMGGAKDGYFLAFDVRTGIVHLSALSNGLVWPGALSQFTRSIAPDPWQAMVIGNPQVWMIGRETSEAWYNTGAVPQPFAPILSSFMQSGTPAPFSVTMAGDAPLWVHSNQFGSARIVKVVGYTPQTISTDAVSVALTDIEGSVGLTDAEALVYQADGHAFACITFPRAQQTWCVDLESGDWHQRGAWVPQANVFDIWRPRVHAYAFGEHLTGERGTGAISFMHATDGLEADGSVIRRVRVAPPLWSAAYSRVVVSRLDIMLDTGLGLQTGQGSDPLVMLQTSRDSRTWGPERLASAGAQGAYGKRLFWTRCGSSNKVWFPRISVSDPVPYRLLSAEINGVGFVSADQAVA